MKHHPADRFHFIVTREGEQEKYCKWVTRRMSTPFPITDREEGWRQVSRHAGTRLQAEAGCPKARPLLQKILNPATGVRRSTLVKRAFRNACKSVAKPASEMERIRRLPKKEGLADDCNASTRCSALLYGREIRPGINVGQTNGDTKELAAAAGKNCEVGDFYQNRIFQSIVSTRRGGNKHVVKVLLRTTKYFSHVLRAGFTWRPFASNLLAHILFTKNWKSDTCLCTLLRNSQNSVLTHCRVELIWLTETGKLWKHGLIAINAPSTIRTLLKRWRLAADSLLSASILCCNSCALIGNWKSVPFLYSLIFQYMKSFNIYETRPQVHFATTLMLQRQNWIALNASNILAPHYSTTHINFKHQATPGNHEASQHLYNRL